MADKVTVDLEENSPSRVAWEMALHLIERDPQAPKQNTPQYREYFLDLYAECRYAAMGYRTFGGKPGVSREAKR